MVFDRDALKAQLLVDEGLRLRPYTDTVGKLSIGVGRNLTDQGITRDEAMDLLDHDIDRVLMLLRVNLPYFDSLDHVRQQVLANMAFNLGLGWVLRFSKMLAALSVGHYEVAAAEMLDSEWAVQVGPRATRLANRMRSPATVNL